MQKIVASIYIYTRSLIQELIYQRSLHVQLLISYIGLPRLAGDSRFSNSSFGHGTGLSRAQPEGQLDRSVDMPFHRLLLTARAHPSNWRIQKFLHSNPWNIKHARPCSSVGLSYLGSPAALLLDFSWYIYTGISMDLKIFRWYYYAI